MLDFEATDQIRIDMYILINWSPGIPLLPREIHEFHLKFIDEISCFKGIITAFGHGEILGHSSTD
jgi:hypothetical protein